MLLSRSMTAVRWRRLQIINIILDVDRFDSQDFQWDFFSNEITIGIGKLLMSISFKSVIWYQNTVIVLHVIWKADQDEWNNRIERYRSLYPWYIYSIIAQICQWTIICRWISSRSSRHCQSTTPISISVLVTIRGDQ